MSGGLLSNRTLGLTPLPPLDSPSPALLNLSSAQCLLASGYLEFLLVMKHNTSITSSDD